MVVLPHFMRFDEKNSSAELEFPLSVYSFQAISSAAKDFASACQVRVEKTGGNKFATVFIRPKSNDFSAKDAAFEFCNFVIGKTREE